MDAMIVLTVKRDGGTQHVVGFYPLTDDGLDDVMVMALKFLEESFASRRAIARIELYNPAGEAVAKQDSCGGSAREGRDGA